MGVPAAQPLDLPAQMPQQTLGSGRAAAKGNEKQSFGAENQAHSPPTSFQALKVKQGYGSSELGCALPLQPQSSSGP